MTVEDRKQRVADVAFLVLATGGAVLLSMAAIDWVDYQVLRLGNRGPIRAVELDLAAGLDPRALRGHLRVLRDEGLESRLLVRTVERRPTATLGDVVRIHLCTLEMRLAPDGATDDDVTPLAEIRRSQDLVRPLLDGKRIAL